MREEVKENYSREMPIMVSANMLHISRKEAH